MVILYDRHFRDTVIDDNIDLMSNNIPEIKDLVISSFHIGRGKYRITKAEQKLPQISPVKKILKELSHIKLCRLPMIKE